MRWEILNTHKIKSDSADNAKKALLDMLLENRGLKTKAEKDGFLSPPSVVDYLREIEPDFIKSLKLAKQLILAEIAKNTPIVIHGDYDADGICATTVLYNAIKNHLGYSNVTYFIPNRFEDGYGLSKSSVKKILDGFTPDQSILIITVDSGITSVDEVAELIALGHKVIITDHHQKPDPAPKPDVLVWNDQIVGASIAWVLSKVLGSTDEQAIVYPAIATITDVQPVLGLNRRIVKEGLHILNNKPTMGLQSLLSVSGLMSKEIGVYEIGWVLGPRINASGRIEDAGFALKLMLSDDQAVSMEYATLLNKINQDRQDKTTEMYEISGVTKENLPKIIITAHTDYHEGIIGLVASRMVQKYYRPSIVISLNDGYGKGSVRSINGIDIISILRQFSDLFENVGGHPMAAGFTIKTENIEVLKERLTAYFDENFSEAEIFIPILNIDLELPLKEVNSSLVETMDLLKPFGVGNREPIFATRNVEIMNISFVGREQNHVSFRFYQDGISYKGIYFSGADKIKDLSLIVGTKVDIAFTPQISEFNGKKSVDLVIKDLLIS